MDNNNIILWDLMKTYLSCNPHIHAVLSKVNVPDDTTVVLTPYTQKNVDEMVNIFTTCMENGELEYMVRMFIGALETVEYATQIAATLSNVDYNAIKESCNRDDVDNLKPLIEQRE